MIENFCFWLGAIVEDNPIPYEIKNIVFLIKNKNGSFGLSMGGTENKPNENNMFDYYPLEAQFFYDRTLEFVKDEHIYQKLIENVIDECFVKSELKAEFHGKKIYVCILGKKAEFLFRI